MVRYETGSMGMVQGQNLTLESPKNKMIVAYFKHMCAGREKSDGNGRENWPPPGAES
jgi:hypothetical protein